MSGMVDMLLTAALSPMYSIKTCGGAAIGTSEKWEALLKTDALQKFLAEAAKASANGGPRNDQEYRFNCKLQTAYPLHFAAMIGDVEAVKALIEASPGAVNVKCAEMGDVRAVGLAATYGQLKVVIALLMAGADPFELNKEGYDACGVARAERHYHVVTLLEEVVKLGRAQAGQLKG